MTPIRESQQARDQRAERKHSDKSNPPIRTPTTAGRHRAERVETNLTRQSPRNSTFEPSPSRHKDERAETNLLQTHKARQKKSDQCPRKPHNHLKTNTQRPGENPRKNPRKPERSSRQPPPARNPSQAADLSIVAALVESGRGRLDRPAPRAGLSARAQCKGAVQGLGVRILRIRCQGSATDICHF